MCRYNERLNNKTKGSNVSVRRVTSRVGGGVYDSRWRHTHGPKFDVYYDTIKRELKIKPISECRFDERLKTNTEESTLLSDTGLFGKLEHLKIKTMLMDEKFASMRCIFNENQDNPGLDLDRLSREEEVEESTVVLSKMNS